MIHGTPWIADLLVLFDFDIARAADGPIEPGDPAQRRATGDDRRRRLRWILPPGRYGHWPAGALRRLGGVRAAWSPRICWTHWHWSSASPACTTPLRSPSMRTTAGPCVTSSPGQSDEIRKDWPGLDDDRHRLRETLESSTSRRRTPAVVACRGCGRRLSADQRARRPIPADAGLAGRHRGSEAPDDPGISKASGAPDGSPR